MYSKRPNENGQKSLYQSRNGFIIDLVDPGLAHHRQARQQLGNLLRGVKLAARFARGRGVHLHQIFVGIAEQVNMVARKAARTVGERQIAHSIQQLHQFFVAFGNGGAELAGVDIQVIEQPFEVLLAGHIFGRSLDGDKGARQGFIQVGIQAGAGAHIGEQRRRQDVEALIIDRCGTGQLGLGVAERGIVKVAAAGIVFLLVHEAGEVFGDETIEQHPQHVGLEVPAVYAAAQVIGNAPDGLVQFGAFGFFGVAHAVARSFF